MSTKTMVLAAVLTALVAVFHVISQFVTIGAVTINLTLIPVVIGGALCGPLVSGWLGLVSAIAILVSPSTALFYGWNVLGTIVTVLIKGTLSGLAAGYVYKLLSGVNRYLGVLAAAIVCPVVNTGIFTLGCLVFFYDSICDFYGVAGNEFFIFFFGTFIGFNFIFELVSNIILSPTTTKIIDIKSKK